MPEYFGHRRRQACDTLNHVAHVIELLKELNLAEGLSPSARAGLFWVHGMLADAVKHVSDELG